MTTHTSEQLSFLQRAFGTKNEADTVSRVEALVADVFEHAAETTHGTQVFLKNPVGEAGDNLVLNDDIWGLAERIVRAAGNTAHGRLVFVRNPVDDRDSTALVVCQSFDAA
jgi:hypothetical protein